MELLSSTVKIKREPSKAQTSETPFPLAEARNQSPIQTANCNTAAKRNEQAHTRTQPPYLPDITRKHNSYKLAVSRIG
jgi:hypothetical protein